jgi:tripartite-type tricarboxylate transporter receptor subunit TctC
MPTRRHALICLALTGAALATMPGAQAQPYPSRPIKIIVPFPAGGPTDVLARIVAEYVGRELGQPLIVEARPGGAGGTVGAKAVVAADPDGYTLLLSQVGALTITPSIYKLDFDPLKNLAPVALVAVSPQILAVTPSLPVTSVAELVAYAKANPGKVNYASPGSGTQPHLLGELFKRVAQIDLVHLPYRGSSPAITDLLAGQAQMMFDSPSVLLAHIQAGKLRALAVASAEPSALLPGVPTVAQAGYPQLEAVLWSGLLAPAGTPAAIVGRLNAAIATGLATPPAQAALARLGLSAKAMSVDAFAAFMAAETKRWAEVVKDANIKLE